MLAQKPADTLYYPNTKLVQSITVYTKKGKTISTYNSNGKLYTIEEFVGEKLDGSKKIYNYIGKLDSEYHYTNGRLNGLCINYLPNGTKKKEETYKNDSLHGVSAEYYEDGTLKLKETYFNGFKIGLREFYFKSGKLGSAVYYDTIHYVNIYKNNSIEVRSVQHGLFKEWFESGKQKIVSHYVKGKKNGEYSEWHENGKLRSKVNFIDDRVEGKQIEYFNNGKLKREDFIVLKYDSSKKFYRTFYEGKFFESSEKGEPRIIGNYKNTKKQGKWKEYSNGVLTLECEYSNGFLINNLKTFHSQNGQLDRNENYKLFKFEGKDTSFIDGESISHYKDGKIAGKTYYENGRSVSGVRYYESGIKQFELFVDKNSGKAYKKDYYKTGPIERLSSCKYDGTKDIHQQKFEIETDYFENGVVKLENVKEANAAPIKREYNEEGKVIYCKYSLSDNISIETDFYPSGALKSEGVSFTNYYKTVGLQYLEWFENGRPKRFENYGVIQLNWLSNGELYKCYSYTNNNTNLAIDTTISSYKAKNIYDFLSMSNNRSLSYDTKDGKIFTTYGPSSVKLSTNMRNGKIDDYLDAYYLSGKPMVHFELKNNVLDGKYTVYLENGKIKEYGNYCQGKVCGAWFKGNLDGDTLEFYQYDKAYDEKEQKKYVFKKEYQPLVYGTNKNPRIKSFYNYKDGVLEGMQYEYHPNGKLHYAKMMVNGKEFGHIVRYWENGKVADDYTVDENSYKQGYYYKSYYTNSSPMMETTYKDNKINGTYKYYWPNGKLRFIGKYENEVKVGEWVTYDSLGNVSKKEKFEAGKKEDVENLNICNCTVTEKKVGFAPQIKDLFDISRADIWQFPFHQSITKYLPNLFYVNYQNSSSNDGSNVFTSLDVVSFSEIITRLPNDKGLKFVLNPCVVFQNNSRIDININVTKNSPKETRMEVSPELLAFRFDTKLISPFNTKIKESDAYFKVKYFNYNEKGIELHEAKSSCFTPSLISNTKLKLELTNFAPCLSEKNLNLTFTNSELLKGTKVFDTEKFYGIINGTGSVTLTEAKGFVLNITNTIVSDEFIAGEIVINEFPSSGTEAKYRIGENAYTEEKALELIKTLFKGKASFMQTKSSGKLLISFIIKQK